jgi:hypothetical protein
MRHALSTTVTASTPSAAARRPPDPDELSRAEVARAVPAGSRRLRSQREAFRAGKNCPDLAGVRADFRKSLVAWWEIHVRHASFSWSGEGGPPRGTTARLSRDAVREKAMTGRPDRETGESRPMSISVAKRCRRWWAERGYIGTVREGTTPELERCRRGVLYDLAPLDGNRTPVYVLCVPRASCRSAGRRPGSQADEVVETRNDLPSSSRREVELPARERAAAKPGSAPQQRNHTRTWPLRGVSDGWWAHLAAPFRRACWSEADLVFAVDHDPGGRQNRERLANVVHPVGWLRWRLSRWLGPDGVPVPSPSQVRKAAHAQVLAEQAARRRQLRQLAAGRAADYAGHAARARAMLAARRPGSIGPVNMLAPNAKNDRWIAGPELSPG